VLLVEGRGDLLTKEQLMNTLWPDTFVEEANLTQHVATLRKALGGSNDVGKYIETVPRLGYRFVAPVEIVANERRPSTVERPSLAVLPFCLIGTDSADSFLSLGIADTLITKLGRSTRISVRSTTAVAKYERNAQDAAYIGRLLDVDFILTGRVYKQEGFLRINLQLVRIADEVTLWTEQFDLTCANVFAIENTLVRKVERALLPAVTNHHAGRKRRRQTRSGLAYQAYLKGRYFWSKRSEEDLKKGIDCFRNAIVIDENYALAYAGLADSYLMLMNYGAMSSKEGSPLAKAASLKALEIDAELGEAHAPMGYIKAAFEWNWAECGKELSRAIELNPADITPRHWYGAFLTIVGCWDQALKELEQAKEIDPVSPILGAVTGWSLYLMRRYEDARAELLRTLDLEQNCYPAHLYLARVCVMQNRMDEAIAEFHKALSSLPGNCTILAELAHALARTGNKAEALQLLERLIRQSEHDYVPAYSVALVYTGLDDADRAFVLLEKACEEPELWLIWLGREPRFESLSGDPRYNDLLKRIGLESFV